MTQNKFWLVSGLNIQRKYKTKKRAEEDAKELAKEHTSEFGVFELVSSFKGEVTKTVNVTETSFEATSEESLGVSIDEVSTVEPNFKFKVGDIVNHKEHGRCKIEQLDCCGHDKTWYCISSDSLFRIEAKEHELTHAEATTDTPHGEFEVGDKVAHLADSKGNKCGVIKSFSCDSWCAYVLFDGFFELEKIDINKLTRVKPETPTNIDKRCTPRQEFKVGDKVYLDNYFDCIVDDYIDETKSYKVSFMGGGYSIANEVRVSSRK